MKLTLIQTNPVIGDIAANTKDILSSVRRNTGVDMLIFPELALTGYMSYDFLFHHTLLRQQTHALQHISTALSDGQVAIVGGCYHATEPEPEQQQSYASPWYNSAYIVDNTGIVGRQDKRVLPMDDVFYEQRYFASGDTTHVFEHGGTRFCILICEDMWMPYGEGSPSYDAVALHPDVVVCISASPYETHKKHKRMALGKAIVEQSCVPFLFVNMVGGNDEIVFDGASFVLQSNATLVHELPHCIACERTVHLAHNNISVMMPDEQDEQDCMPLPTHKHRGDDAHHIFMQGLSEVLQMGLLDYVRKSGMPKRVHLGISGGIDSAVVAVLATLALGNDAVTGILLPSQYTSEASIRDAHALTKALNIQTHTLSIEQMYHTAIDELAPLFENSTPDLTEENLQARLRGVLLMAYSNKFGSMLLTTGNKSEVAVGYCTLYGDMCGAINLIGDLYKTEVYQLASFLNHEHELIPHSIIEKAPTAELRYNQKDSDSLPPYPVLDDILRQFIEHHRSPEEVCTEQRYDKHMVDTIWRLYTRTEYKRHQAPPIIKVSQKAFGRGRLVPLATDFSHM